MSDTTPEATTPEITAQNVGPIENLTVKFRGYGLTILKAGNGRGKSWFLKAVQGLATSDGGGLPLRRGAEKGSIEGFGARITIGKINRAYGEFQVETIEGRLNLGALFAPGLKDPKAADKRRLNSLLSINGVKGDANLFLARPEFDEATFSHCVTTDALQEEDLVKQASLIARCYQAEARTWEELAREDLRRAEDNAERCREIDMDAPSDSEALAEEHAEASRMLGVTTNARFVAGEQAKQAKEAQDELARWDAQEVGESVEGAEKGVQSLTEQYDATCERIVALEAELTEQRGVYERERDALRTANTHLTLTRNAFARREACEKAIAKLASDPGPTEEDEQKAILRLRDAKAAMEKGALVRAAASLAEQGANFQASHDARKEKADKLRAAAAATDNVLSDAIPAGVLRIKEKRVVIDHPVTDEEVCYDELSQAQSIHVAVKVGAEAVGEGGLLVVDQEAFEGVDHKNREAMHALACALKVYILTAQATRGADEDEEITAITVGAEEVSDAGD